MAPVATTSASNNTNGLGNHSHDSSHLGFSTRAIHIGSEPSEETGALIPAISLSTTFKQDGVGGFKQYEYSRSANPNRDSFERALASLEGGKYGLAFASGSAVTATIMNALGPYSHIISVNDVYGGSYRYFNKVASQAQGIETSFLDLGGEEESVVTKLKENIRPNTKLVWIETPTNPTLRLIDIALVAKTVKSIKSDVAVVVDSTFLSPWYQTPLLLGADIVSHSVTKYINGHSDVVMGAIVTNDSAWAEKLKFLQNSIGAVPSAFDCWLALRGLKTLSLRMQAHGTSALQIATKLSNHPAIETVIYPGLPSHPSFNLALKQINPRALEKAKKSSDVTMTGFPYGGMVTLRLKSDPKDDGPANRFLEHLQIFSLAESLGGVESLIEMPSKMTHAAVSEEDRAKLGIGYNLIRVSVGLEDVDDLIKDLDQAFKAAGLV